MIIPLRCARCYFSLTTPRPSAVITCAEGSRAEYAGGAAAQPDIQPRGIDLEHFIPSPRSKDAPSVAKPSCRYRLLSVGRLAPRGGYEIIIEALTWLPETELLIAGGADGREVKREPEHDRLAALAEELGVADRVRLVGQIARADMPALMRSADLVVCSPWYQAFGTVPLEAMACGVPGVASAVGGMLDMVIDGVTGTLVTPRDPVALAEMVGALLEAPSRRAQFAQAGLDWVRNCYSWDRVAADTAAVYEQTARSRDAGHAMSAPLG